MRVVPIIFFPPFLPPSIFSFQFHRIFESNPKFYLFSGFLPLCRFLYLSVYLPISISLSPKIDITPPTLHLIGNSSMFLQGSFPWHDPGCLAYDTASGNLTANVTIGGQKVDSYAPAGTEFFITYNVKDAAGNAAMQLNRTIIIIDTIPPIIQLDGPATVQHQGATPWSDPGFTAYDLLDGNITALVQITGKVDIWAQAGASVLLAYNVKDYAGNAAITRYRRVVEIDTIPPNITLFGNATLTLEAATPWKDPGFWAWDTLDGNLTLNVVVGGDKVNVYEASGTSFNVTYNVVDHAGNNFQTFRIVKLIDTIPPNITLYGPSFLEHEGATPYVDPGAWAWDNLNGNLTNNITVTGIVHVWAPAGSNFTISYHVHDAAGNFALVVTRTIMIVDTVPPVVYLIGPSSLAAEAGWPYLDLWSTANDTLDGNLTDEITVNVSLFVPQDSVSGPLTIPYLSLAQSGNLSIINTFAPLESVYSIIYSVRDKAGNLGFAVREVKIVDTLPPSLVIIGPNRADVRIGSSYLDAGALAFDTYFGDMTADIELFIQPDCNLDNLTNIEGMKSIFYLAKDKLGHETIVEGRIVNVIPPAQSTTSQTHSIINIAFEMNFSTPYLGDTQPVAYIGQLTTRQGASLNNISEVLMSVGIASSFVSCATIDSSCIFEAYMMTADKLALLFLNTDLIASASKVAVPIMHYIGAFSTAPLVSLSLEEAINLLNEKGITPGNVTCAVGFCSFSSFTRPSTTAQSGIYQQRRSLGTAEIDQLFIAHVLEPVLKREIIFSFAEFSSFSIKQLYHAMQLVQIQPSSVNCNAMECTVHTFDPLSDSDLTLLRTILFSASVTNIIDQGYFVESTGIVQLAESLSLPQVQFSLLQAGFPPRELSCNETTLQCIFRTFNDVQSGKIQLLPSPFISIQIQIERSSPLPQLPYGLYESTLTIADTLNANNILQQANITEVYQLSCTTSILFDNAQDCIFLLNSPLKTLSSISSQTGVYIASGSQPVSLASSFERALLIRICK